MRKEGHISKTQEAKELREVIGLFGTDPSQIDQKIQAIIKDFKQVFSKITGYEFL